MTSEMDVLPTFVKLAGGQVPKDADLGTGRRGTANDGPGVRHCGYVDKAQPLMRRNPMEND